MENNISKIKPKPNVLTVSVVFASAVVLALVLVLMLGMAVETLKAGIKPIPFGSTPQPVPTLAFKVYVANSATIKTYSRPNNFLLYRLKDEIDFRSYIHVLGRSQDGQWLYVSYSPYAIERYFGYPVWVAREAIQITDAEVQSFDVYAETIGGDFIRQK